jgi:hypothetical protein
LGGKDSEGLEAKKSEKEGSNMEILAITFLSFANPQPYEKLGEERIYSTY